MELKGVTIELVIAALEEQTTFGAILIGATMDAAEIGRLYHSESPWEEEYLNGLKELRKIIYFFGKEDCPVLMETFVDLLIINKLYIVKLV